LNARCSQYRRLQEPRQAVANSASMSYESPVSRQLYGINPSGTGPTTEAYVGLSAQEAELKESWFRDSIAGNPDLVMGVCRRAGLTNEKWFCWGTEVKTGVGPIDVLLVSETGRIGIVETKLSLNPEKRRSVVAQLLEYAVNLRDRDLDDISESLPVESLVKTSDAQRRLKEGDYLLVVAGDELDPRAVRLGEAVLGKHVLQKWDLALVDLALYRRPTDKEANLLVPTLRGTLVAERRQVFEVKFVGLPEAFKPQVTAVEPPPPTDGQWDEARFKLALEAASLPPAFKNLGRRLLKLTQDYPELEARFGRGKSGSLILKRNGYGLIEFDLAGNLRFRRTKIERALPATTRTQYFGSLKAIFSEAYDQVYPLRSADQIVPKADDVINALQVALQAARESEE